MALDLEHSGTTNNIEFNGLIPGNQILIIKHLVSCDTLPGVTIQSSTHGYEKCALNGTWHF